MRLTMRFIPTLILLCAANLPLAAQTRTRRIAEFDAGRQTVRVATVDGNVRVDARSVVEAVAVVASPGETRLWVDSVRSMMRRPLHPESGEELGLETSTGTLQYVLRVSRTEEPGRPSRYRLDMHDHQLLNSVLVPMTSARLSEFLDAVTEAARAGDHMRGVLPALPADSADTAPALTREAREMIAAALSGQYLTEPILLEAVVGETGIPEPAGTYVLGGGTQKFEVEPLIPRLRFSPATERGQPMRTRVRLTLAERGGPEARQPPPPDSMPRLLNSTEIQAALVRLYPRLYRDAGVTGDVTITVEVDTTGVPDLATVEVLNVALEEFQNAAIQVVGQMRFRPAQRDGQAVRARTVIPIRFSIRR
jgi:TonB family protein